MKTAAILEPWNSFRKANKNERSSSHNPTGNVSRSHRPCKENTVYLFYTRIFPCRAIDRELSLTLNKLIFTPLFPDRLYCLLYQQYNNKKETASRCISFWCGFFLGYRTFCVFFNANEASVYRASLAFIFSEMIFEGGQKVL